MWVGRSGSMGTDHSANPSAVPGAGLVSLVVINANTRRNHVAVQNQSAGAVQLVRDDGTGANQTSILLASGGAAGTPGGSFDSDTFKGRLTVYGAAGAQVAAYED